MACENSWTFEFYSNGLEIRPLSMNYQGSWNQHSFVRAKFQTDVGEVMQPMTRDPSGSLHEPSRVGMKYNGDTVVVLYFRPDFARYGNNYTHLEFRDLRKSFNSGTIDKNWTNIQLQEAYQYVWDNSPDGLVTGIDFNIPENIQTNLIGEAGASPDLLGDVPILSDALASQTQPISGAVADSDSSSRLIDSYYAIDIDQFSPLESFQHLNNKFGIVSWVDNGSTLWFGFPEGDAETHVAAPDDERVWRTSGNGVQISHPREPIKQVTVAGAWIDDPSSGERMNREYMSQFYETTDSPSEEFLKSATALAGDVRAHGIAYQPDVDYGQEISFIEESAKRDGIEAVAKSQMQRLIREQNQGTVEINADHSSNYTALHQAKPGDFIHIIPRDDPHCDTTIQEDIYLITEVQQNVDDTGFWSTTFDVSMYPDNQIETQLRFFDPRIEQYLTEEEVFGDK